MSILVDKNTKVITQGMTGASGTEEQPGLRIVVGYQNPEKK